MSAFIYYIHHVAQSIRAVVILTRIGQETRGTLEQMFKALTLGPERTLQQDTAFGFRQLVDIAERDLSPGINDPTTAVQAIDQLHDLLRRMVRRRFPSASRKDETGMLRLICPRPDWDSYVRLALDEVRQYGKGSIQVTRRLRFLLEDLLRVAPAFRRGELERQLVLLEASVERAFETPQEAALAIRASPQGHGPT